MAQSQTNSDPRSAFLIATSMLVFRPLLLVDLFPSNAVGRFGGGIILAHDESEFALQLQIGPPPFRAERTRL